MKIEYVRNEHGINIKVCCASCKMRKITSQRGRVCGLRGNKVKAGNCCDRWEMNRRLQNAGMSGGQVKSWRYLSYYRERWTEQRSALLEGRITATQMLSVKEIRDEFETENGSIYINL